MAFRYLQCSVLSQLQSFSVHEIVLETIYQLTIQLILLLNAISKTKTSEAFDVVFNDDLSKGTIVATLIFSTIWSFFSCSLAHTKGKESKIIIM